MIDLRHRQILITGANGFIGGRLAERLVQEEGAQVRGLVRYVRARHSTIATERVKQIALGKSDLSSNDNSTNASPLRNVEIVIGDITDVDAVRQAVDGCYIVVHCAAMQSGRAKIEEYRRVNIGGTLNLMRAARDAKIWRFIHISTINVHGFPPPPNATADSPLNFSGDFYSVSKAEGEQAAWEFARANDLPFVVVRPACTYGPRSQAWTMTPLQRVQRGRPVLIGAGDGICNTVYIDDLIDLIVLAIKHDAAVGQAFIGADGRGVTWREFYDAYAKMLGIARVNSMPRWFALAAANGFGWLAKIDGYPPRVARSSIEFYSHRVVFDIDKSKRLLGYEPKISFEEGMARTRQWLMDNGQYSVKHPSSNYDKIENPKS